ncbi:MAG: 4Fe-4S dicluster domain-containing protein [Deltaproteobacteria bacterium]|nr:4Fe-4S dicluster domain-containing protein [Deltaproteobacteria bacterium]
MISLTINNQTVEMTPDATVLEAAKKLRIYIPTLCHHEALEPYGGCRLCVVEVEKDGRSRLTASCTLPVEEGLSVLTDSPRVVKARKMTLELLLARCPQVPALQRLAAQMGVTESKYAPGDSDCILCGLCVRICQQLQNVGAIGMVGRGAKREVLTPFGEFSEVCRTCGACAFVCPTGHIADVGQISGKTPLPKLSEFNVGLTARGNIYRLYPQAVPNTPAIDPSNCIQILTGDCGACAQACLSQAIEFDQKPEQMTVNVGSVVLAPGFKTVDARLLGTYGYGNYPNVVTNLEFERLLSPGGPTTGHVKRASDGREPAKIAWIQCAGSRSVSPGAKEYCSSYCCMAALKQALIAQEHVGPGLETTIFFMDMRTSRKEYEKYLERAKDQGVQLIRCRPHSIDEIRGSHDLRITYVTEAGEVQDEVFDLVVLSVAMETSGQTRQLAADLGVQLDEYDFIDSSCFTPVTTSQPGIYACGVALGPKDIPETVLDASAAATAATRLLAPARGTQVKKKFYPPERAVAQEEPRVGVFVCNCGINIGGFVDVPAIAENAREIPGVAYVQENLFTCSQDAQKQMAEKIQEHNLNRVVVAACSPATHQAIFQDMMRNAGLNKYLFEMANIRNQCSWVHQGEPDKATGKCKDLVRMAVAKATLLDPLEYLQVDINKRALVIGGGLAGMNAALSLADQGYEVHLVERLDRLGGNARRLLASWKGEIIQPYLDALVEEVNRHPRITVHYWSIVEEVAGTVGNYRSRLSTGQEIEHGIVVIAIGAEPLRPSGMYLYRRHPNVLLTLDFDRELARKSQRISDAKAVAFIQCVGSRIPERPYCSRICCKHSVENAVRLKETYPEMEVAIIYRDLRTDGKLEKLYKKARDLGVLFLSYTLDDPPQVDYEGDQILITVKDQVLQKPVRLSVDILTLATAVIPHRNAPLAELYKIPLNAEGFFNEAHAKIRPVDAATEGVFLAGLCHYPKFIHEAVAEGLAAASRANTILSQDYLELEATISRPVDEHCDGCAFCVDACPFQAITLLEYMKDGTVKKTVEVNEVLCKGCGSCMATCPKQGIYVAGFTLVQLGAQVEAALGLR